MKTFTDNADETTLKQIEKMMKSPIAENAHVRIMPDCHAGAGCVIGTTMKIHDKVCPNIVGVDIGCGVLTIELGNIDIDFEALDSFIKESIPSGFSVNEEEHDFAKEFIFYLRCKRKLKNKEHLYKSLGTLGGGNHFIEIDVDDDGNKYLLIHTGSRQLGFQIAQHYQSEATRSYEKKFRNKKQEIIKKLKKEGREKEIQTALNAVHFKRDWDKSLDYLEGDLLEDYLNDMEVAQSFAKANRFCIGKKILGFLNAKIKTSEWFDTVHNYIDTEEHILRKGAVSAQKGEHLVIPINMRDGALICSGKGNEDWNYSAPHGAGRILSRTEAKNTITEDDMKNAMKGIYTTTANKKTLDEAPMAYKPIDTIVKNIKDTVDIEKRIRPIYNFKAN